MTKLRIGQKNPLKVDYDRADVQALQALWAGNANESQQKKAIDFIVNGLSGAFDQSFRPGEEGRRETDFAEGKRFVGLEIWKLLRINPSIVRKTEHAGESE